MSAENEMKEFLKEALSIDDIQYKLKQYKPNEITDDIINSINISNINGLTNEQVTQLNNVVKQTLIEVRKDNIDREVALVYDINGYKNQYGQWLFKTTGDSNTDVIDLSKSTDINHLLNIETKRVVVISHNHPKNKIISLLDFRTFCREQNIFLIVAITNSGKLSYIVKNNFNYNKYLEVTESIINSYNAPVSNDVFLVDLLNSCDKFGVIFSKE